MREDVLLFECPDELRRLIVAEFIAKHAALPREDAADSGERRAALYHQSALDREQLSTIAGQQLTAKDRSEWEAVWTALPMEANPT